MVLAGRVFFIILDNMKGIYYGIYTAYCVDLTALGRPAQVELQPQLGLRPQRLLRAAIVDRAGAPARGVHPPRLLSRQVLKLRLARRGHNVMACRTLRVTGSLLAQYPEWFRVGLHPIGEGRRVT